MVGIIRTGKLFSGLGGGSFTVAPPEPEQDTGNQTSSNTTSDTATFASDTTTGNAVIVMFALKGGRRVSTLVDNKGNVYTRVGFVVDVSDAVAEMWYSAGITGGASHTLTVTYDAAAYVVWGAIEVSRIKGGGGFLDARTVATFARAGAGSSVSVSVTSGVPRGTNEMFVAMLALAGGGADAGIDTPTNWTAITQFNNYDSIMAGHGAYRVNANATALTATWTNDTTTAPAAAIIAAFRATNAVSAGVAVPVNTVAPAITGTTTEGETLTASTGTWANSPDAYTYQWKDDGVAISGATASTYVLTASEVGATITCTVTASNEGGSTSATSAGVGPVESSVQTAGPTHGAHRYWRINSTGGGICSITELEFWESLTGSKIATTGGSIIVSGTGEGSSANLFDGDTSSGNYWYSGALNAGSAGYDWGVGNAVSVGAVRVIGRHGASQCPDTFDVQYSDDGSSWTTAWTVTSVASLVLNQGANGWFFPDPDGGFKAWRIRFQSDATGAARLSEAQFRQTVGGADVSSEAHHRRTYNDAAGNVSNLFDGNTATEWATNAFPGWVMAFFNDNRSITQIAVTAPVTISGQEPDNIYLDWSADGFTWTNVFAEASVGSWSSAETKIYAV